MMYSQTVPGAAYGTMMTGQGAPMYIEYSPFRIYTGIYAVYPDICSLYSYECPDVR